MFDQLRKAFSNATRNLVQRELTEKDIDNTLTDLEIALLQSDIAQEVIDDLVVKLKKDLVGIRLEKGQNGEDIIISKFRNSFVEIFSEAGDLDLLKEIKLKKEGKAGPFVIAFLGINGTGKTTTVAKVARLLRKNNVSVVLAAGDTHRAGAIEQLSRHAERLSLKVITQRYGADPSAVGRDAIDYAKKHHIDAVLVDTAGRMQTAKNLMDEISKIVRVVKPDIKLFVGDALAGNDTINQAREFFQYTDFDGALLTKLDADAKGGAAISIVHITSRPIIFLGIGQGYDDLVAFDAGRFMDSILRDTPLADTQAKISYPLSEKGQSSDDIVKDGQRLENSRKQELPEEEIISNIKHPELGDFDIEKEKQGINQSQYGPSNSSDSLNLENPSTAPDESPLEGLSTGTEKHEYEEQDKKIMDSRADQLGERDQDPNSYFPTHSVRAGTDHENKVNRLDRKNKKARFGGFFGRWKKPGDENKEDLTGNSTKQGDEQNGNVDLVVESRSKYQNKDKEKLDAGERNPRGRQETKQKKHIEDMDKDDEGNIVYLSNEDIEDMLK
jgi:fused signal recognition particle receptor